MTSVPFVTALLIVAILVTLGVPILYRFSHDTTPAVKTTSIAFAAWLIPVFMWVWLELHLYGLRPDWFATNPTDINLLYASIIAAIFALFAAFVGFVSDYVGLEDDSNNWEEDGEEGSEP